MQKHKPKWLSVWVSGVSHMHYMTGAGMFECGTILDQHLLFQEHGEWTKERVWCEECMKKHRKEV